MTITSLPFPCSHSPFLQNRKDKGRNKEREKYMLLKRIEIRNLRKIKQAEIEFHGKTVQVIQGLNKSGKSTIGQAIALTLGGVKEVSPGIIKLGENEAEVIAYTDDGLKIRTIINEDKVNQDVSILNESSGRYAKVSGGVRAFIDSIRSNLEAPFAIKDWTDEAIIELIKERSGFGDVIENLDEEIKALEEERTQIGRDKRKKGTPEKVEKVVHAQSIDELIKKKEIIKNKIEEKTSYYQEINTTIRNAEIKDITTFERYVLSLQEALAIAREIEEREETKYTKNDIEKIDNEILEWNKVEAKANLYDKYLADCEEIKKLEDLYQDFTNKIEAKRKEREEVLKGMELGIKGLEITEDGKLIHNGVLRGITKTNAIGNWSTAQTLQVLFLLGLRFCGKLKVMVVDNAESLDEVHTKLISELAEKHGFLIIMLKVGSIPEEMEENIIYIKDGSIMKEGDLL